MNGADLPRRWWPLWGVFCACSWTWCIGMYLPRIMLERHGWAGFLVFMIPNVLGCAALGYVLRTRERADAIITRHRRWAMAFSAVTIAYHAYFAVFLAVELLPEDGASTTGPGLAAGLVLGLGAVGWLLSRLGDRGWLVLSGITWSLSLLVLLVLSTQGSRLPEIPAVRDGLELATIAPVTVLGFLLCPYLDLTFLRAHRASAGTHAFGVFGLAFAIMLVLTCVLWFADRPVLGPWALVHLGIQGAFTVGAHLRELAAHCRGPAAVRAGWMLGPFAVGLAFALAAAAGAGPAVIGEDSYMRFLAFYGLLFPAAVLVLVATPVALADPRRHAVTVLLACGLLAPLMEAGFIGRVPGATLPVAAAAAAFAIIRWRLRRAGGPAGEASNITGSVRS